MAIQKRRTGPDVANSPKRKVPTVHNFSGLGGNELEGLAAKLGGEVDGDWVRCPSPGFGPGDRSCRVRIDGQGQPYIYNGSQAAYAMLRQILGLKPRRKTTTADAARVWDETRLADDTVVERYLASRGIVLPAPADLRFHRSLRHHIGSYWPAMVGARRNAAGVFKAVHETFLAPDGKGKAPVDPQKRFVGPCKGTSIHLAPVARRLVVGEGIETTLSAMQLTRLPGWAAGSCDALREIELPTTIRSVLIFADGEPQGRSAARDAEWRLRAEGREVKVYHAPDGKDFNDLLRERSQ